MTGDGVNDVLALKDADCSVAMASGSDAAAQASQLVLLESDFARMPDVVLEGRQVVNNLQRSGSLFLVKNIFSFLMSMFSIMFAISYPLEPSQISLISMFTIGLPGFLLSQVPNKDLIKGHFLTNVLLKALPAGLTNAIVVGALVIYGDVFNVSNYDISTAATMLLAIVGFMILYQISKPMDPMRWGIWGILCGRLYILPGLFKRSVCHYRHVFPVHPAVCGILGGNRTTVPVSDSVGKKIPQPLPETQAPAGRIKQTLIKRGCGTVLPHPPLLFPWIRTEPAAAGVPLPDVRCRIFLCSDYQWILASESYTPGYTDPGPP